MLNFNLMEHKIDRLWELSEPVVERILSFIPLKRILQLSILSKRWQNVWTLFPLPKFDSCLCLNTLYEISGNEEKQKIMIKRKELEYFVERTLVSRYRQKLSINKFNLRMQILEKSADCELANRWIGYAIESNVKELNLDLRPILYDSDSQGEAYYYQVPKSTLTAKSIIELKLTSGNLKFKSSYTDINLPSLKKLVLSHVKVDDQIVQTLISGCPIVEEIKFGGCVGLKNIHVSGLPKLMAFELDFYYGLLESFEMEAPNLKKLVLCSSIVTDIWLHNVLSKHPLIESLKLRSCNMLKRIKISSDCMKSLTFSMCRNLVELNNFTPNLHRLQYCGHAITLISSNTRTTLSEVSLDFDSNIYAPNARDAAMNVEKIEFLAKLHHPKLLIWSTKDAQSVITPKVLRETLPSPLYNVKQLELRAWRLKSINKLVNTLLWISPRLEILFIKWGHPNTDDSISFKFSYENPVHKLENPNCCKLLPVLCWRHCLKTIKIENPGGTVKKEILKKYFFDNAEILESFQWLKEIPPTNLEENSVIKRLPENCYHQEP